MTVFVKKGISKKTRILIAGHTGFIGSALEKKLSKNELYELVCLSKSNGFDLTQKIDLKNIVCDVVINLSSLTSINESWENPFKYYKNNYLSTLNLLEYARNCGARFIQISSYTYGSPEYQPVDEKHPIIGHNPYASSKIISDQLCKDYSNQFNIPITILKPFNIYGNNQSESFLIKQMIRSAVNGEKVKILDLHARRDYLWIDDFISAILKVENAQENGFFIYNVGSGVSCSAKEIFEIIKLYFNDVSYGPINGNFSKLQVQNCICDNNLFSTKFNWQPKVGLKEGIKKMMNIRS